MTMDPIGGANDDARATVIRSHLADLLAEAAVERQLRDARCQGEHPAGVRRRLGLALVRVGHALAGESPRHAGPGQAVRPT